MPLQLRIGVFVVAGLIIIFTLFGILGWSVLHQSVQRTMDERLVVAQLLASYLDSELEEQFELLERSGPLIGGLIDNRPPNAKSSVLLHQEPFVSGVFLVDSSGAVRWSEPPTATLLTNETIAALHSGQVFDNAGRYLSGVRRDGSSEGPFILIAVRARDSEDASIGVVGAVIDVNHLTFRRLVDAARELGKTGHAELLDQAGLVIASSDPHRVLEPGEHPEFYLPLLKSGVPGNTITQPIGDEDPAELGQRHAMVFAPFRVAPWGLSLGGSETELYAEAHRWRWQVASLGGLALLAALAMVWLTTRSVALSVRALTRASQRMGAGDLATPVPDLREGEVHALAEALDDMRGHLKEALDDLAIEKSRYQGIVKSMDDGVFTTDCQCRVTAFNPAAEALTGWRSDEAVGRGCVEIFPPPKGDRGATCLSRCIKSEAILDVHSTVAKEVVHRPDRSTVPVTHARSAIRDLDGTLSGIVHVLHDVSAEEEVERLKDKFLSMVSHELRTPLGHIKGYATTLLLPDAPMEEETKQKCLRVIVEASDELDELVGNLLDMSSIGAGAFRVNPRPVRLGPLLRAAVERAELSASHRLRAVIPARLPFTLVDTRRLEQVLHNLLDNALKYSPNGSTIEVSAKLAGDEVLIGIADEGIGIPADEIGALFEPFHRGVRTRGVSGSGLGLAVCKGIVEAHGGRVWVESPAPGRARGPFPGTVVRVTLPVSAIRIAGRRVLRTSTEAEPSFQLN